MNANPQASIMKNRKALFSALWIYLTANYIYCDHLSNMEPEVIQDLVTGRIGTIQVTQGFLLAAAVMMQIPFLMIVLSRVLKYKANRWANIIAGILMIVVQIGPLAAGIGSAPSLVYLFYSAIEVAVNLLIIWLAFKWPNPAD